MKTITEVLSSMPWSSMNVVFLFVVNLLLVLIAWRLYSASRRYIDAIETIASAEKEQKAAINEQTGAFRQCTKTVSDLADLERLKFLDQLEFYYQNRAEDIKLRLGLQGPLDEERFMTGLAKARVDLSRNVFDDIVLNATTVDRNERR